MSKHGTSTQTQTVDPGSQTYIDDIRRRAQGYADRGFSPYDPKMAMGFMNPYLEAMNPLWDKIRASSLNAVDSRATEAGAYGGSRNSIAQGQALTGIADAQAQQNYGAYQNAQGQAYQEFLRQQNFGPDILRMLEGAIGPTGMTSTQQTSQQPWMQLLGLGLSAINPLAGLGVFGAGAQNAFAGQH